MTEVCTLDLGFGWTKGQRENRRFVQPSIIGEAKDMFDSNIKPDDFFYNEEYFVGKLAQRHSDVKYHSMKDNKAESGTSEILINTALGYLNRSSSFNLVTGLPLKFFFTQQDDMKNVLEKFKEVNILNIKKGNHQYTNVQPELLKYKLVPQGQGIAMDYLLKDDGTFDKSGVARKKILVVDLGFYTLGLLGLDKMEIMKESYSQNIGVDNAYKLLQSYIQNQFGKSPARYDLDPHVIEGKYEGVDITNLIRKAFRALAQQIQNEIDGVNIKFDYYLIGGGAAHYIFEYLNLHNKILFDQLAQIRGYRKIGVRLWK